MTRVPNRTYLFAELEKIRFVLGDGPAADAAWCCCLGAIPLNEKRSLMPVQVAAIRRTGGFVLALTMAAAVVLTTGNPAVAAIVPTVPLGTSADYAVLAGSTVTNTGLTTLNGGLGLWPGTSITGFPLGLVLPPGRTDRTNATAKQAQSDLTVAYANAANRPIDATTTADLVNLKLTAGVYAGPNKSPLSLSGPLVLDGAGDPSSVFIFQTDSTLTTASASTVTLINVAQECNVFWQVGSSATLGTGSVFVGNILALTSITVNSGVTVRGRALARNGAVTLDSDTFTRPTCAQAASPGGTGVTVPTAATGVTAATGTTVPAGGATGTTAGGGGTVTTSSGGGTGTTGSRGSTPTTSRGRGTGTTATTARGANETTSTGLGRGTPGPGVPSIVGPPRTGADPGVRSSEG